MALATQPRMLLLDEPMAGMGPDESARMVAMLRALKGGITILLIEHDMETVFALPTASPFWSTAASSRPARRRRSARMPPCAKPISASRKRPMAERAMAEMPLLEVSGIETSYGLSRVLFGISLAVAPGEMVSLMGRNGMGKTTTVRSIMGLTRATAGSIR